MHRSPMYDKFEAYLRQARNKRELSQAEVAALLGKPQSFVSKYESGERRLDVIEFLAVCDALKIKPNDVLKALEA